MERKLRILIVEDDPLDSMLIERELATAGLLDHAERVWSEPALRRALTASHWDMILSDHSMPYFSAPEVITLTRALRPEIPIIIVSGEIDLDLAVSLLRSGARDYVRKSDLKRLSLAVERELREIEGERDRQAMMTALADSEETLRAMYTFFDLTPNLLLVADTSRRIRRMNRRWEQTLGYPIEILQRKQLRDLIHPDDLPAVLDLTRQMDPGQVIKNYLFRLRHRDGTYRTLEWQAFVFDKIVYGVARDITEQVVSEKACRETNALYRALFEQSGDAVFILDGDTLVDCNPKLPQLLGVSREALIGAHPWAFSTALQSDGQTSEQKGHEIFAPGQTMPRQLAWRFQRFDGSVLDLELTVSVPDFNSGLTLCIGQTVSEERFSRFDVMHSQALLRSLIDSIPDLIFIKDINSVYIGCNKAFEVAFGRPKHEIAGRTDFDFVDRDLASYYRERDRLMLEAGIPLKNEEWIPFADGSRILAETIKTPYYGPNGERLGLIGISRDITDRRRAQDIFDKAFTENPCPMSISDLDTGNYIEVNYAWLATLGYDRGEVIGKTVYDLDIYWDSKDRALVVNAIKTFGRADNLEIKFRSKTGRLVIGLFFGEMIDIAGSPMLLTTVLNISDLRSTERDLQASQNRLHALISAIPDIFHVVRRDGVIMDYHAADIDTMGLPPGAFLGKNIFDLLPNAFTGRLNQAMQAILDEGQATDTFTYEMTLKEELRAYEARVIPFGEEMIMTIIRDITESLRAETARRESDERLRTLINVMPDIVCFKDGQGRWLEANDFGRKLFHLDGVSYQGKTDMELADLSPFYRETFEAALSSDELAWQSSGFRRTEEIIPRPDGEPLVFDVIKVPTFEPDGRRKGLLVVGRDITLRKIAEEESRQLNAELEQKVEARTLELAQANQRLESYAYSLTHDLRSPVRHMQGFTEILLSEHGDGLDEPSKQYLKIIQRASGRMSDLIDAMLGLSQLVQKRLDLQLVDVSALACSIMDELVMVRPGCKVRFECTPNLTAAADETLLRTALYNLLDNAVKYSAKRTDPAVKFECFEQNGESVFCVRDNGAGFDMRFAENLFTPFKRLHSDQEFPGLGVGLATVQRIIAEHHGRIWAESSPGSGASFYFTLGVPHA